MEKLSKEQEIIKILFKEPEESYNSRNISKKIGMSHAGAFKILEALKKKEIVISKKVGKANIYSLNLKDKIAEKSIEIALTLESRNYLKWVEEFRKIGEKSSFIILFGSILRNEKEAKDIDLLIVLNMEKLKEIEKEIERKKNILIKPLHALYQTPEEFIKSMHSKNKVSLEILKTGIVLYGQERVIDILKEL